jgi:pilin isopeptide linkage protein
MRKVGFLKRAAAAALSLLLVVGGIPSSVLAAEDEPASVSFEVENEIEGEKPAEPAQFTFIMERSDENGANDPLQDKLTLNINGEDTATFGPIKYTEPGTYVYTISEVQGNVPGYIYNYYNSSYRVEVNVRRDANGKLQATAKEYKIGEDGKSEISNFVNLYETPTVSMKFLKADADTNEPLAGASLKVVDSTDNSTVAQWTSTAEAYTIEELIVGHKYQLVETQAPEGYEIADPVDFDVTTDSEDQTITMVDKKTPVKTVSVGFQKVDADTQQPLSGAVLSVVKITDNGDESVAEWTTDGTVHTIEGLIVGQEYRLTELSAPSGYSIAEEIVFTVTEDSNMTITMADKKLPQEPEQPKETKVTMNFQKTNEAGEGLAGAQLRVVDVTDADNHTIMDSWTSDGNVHTITNKLIVGHTYRLVEIQAPEGYEYAADVEFTVSAESENQTISMADTAKPQEVLKGSVTVTKQLTLGNNVKIAPEDRQRFYIALFDDADCTRRVTEIMPLDFERDSTVSVAFDELEPGKTYYLGEVEVNGIKLVSGVIENVVFSTDFIQGQAVTASAQAGEASLTFNNEFQEIPQHFYREGELNITKSLVDASGNAVNASTTFYAGIFADSEFTKLSDQVSTNILPLQLNGTSQVSGTVKTVLPESGALKLYVTEVDANGTPVSANSGFAYEVTVNGSAVSMDANNTSAAVTIINKMKPSTPVETNPQTESETETKTSAATGTTTGTGTTGTTASSVKTGDETPTELYTILLAGAAVILLVLVEIRRRRSRNA